MTQEVIARAEEHEAKLLAKREYLAAHLAEKCEKIAERLEDWVGDLRFRTEQYYRADNPDYKAFDGETLHTRLVEEFVHTIMWGVANLSLSQLTGDAASTNLAQYELDSHRALLAELRGEGLGDD